MRRAGDDASGNTGAVTGIIIGVVALALLAILFFARKGGKDAVRAKAAEKTVEQIAEANRTVDNPERERLRSRYRRD